MVRPGRDWRLISIVSIAVISLVCAVGGSVAVSLVVANQTKHSICSGFEYFIRPPTAPPGPLRNREIANYGNLLIFEHKIGCK
jgi:hypothetical protein